MEANTTTILDFIGKTKKMFKIPIYQRHYNWKSEQCIQLFFDIEKIIMSDYSVHHFLGTVIYVEENSTIDFREFVIIDGQQRITSIMLLLHILYNKIDDTLYKEEIKAYLLNENVAENKRFKLKLLEEDMIYYQKIIDEDQFLEHSNIVKNYQIFQNMIEQSSYTFQQFYKALNYITFVYISLEKNKKTENPQLIFESLNSTGLALTQSDLIRNFLFMNMSYEQQYKLYERYWKKIEICVGHMNISEFIYHYFVMKTGKLPNHAKIYKSFTTLYQNVDEERILQELLTYAYFYQQFLYLTHINSEINELFSVFIQLQAQYVYPFFLSLFYECYSVHSIKENELIEGIQLIISYIVRRIICQYPTKILSKIFAQLSKEIKHISGYTFIEKLHIALLKKQYNAVFPKDAEFKQGFLFTDLYKTKIAKYIFFEFEKLLTQKTELIFLTDNITIEHIMPQKLTTQWKETLGTHFIETHKQYVHTLGNLTITGSNLELSNKSFEEKKKIFLTSNILLNRLLVKYETWNGETIKERAEMLFSLAIKIWKMPKSHKYYDLSEKNIDTSYEYQLDDIKPTGHIPRKVIIEEKEFYISSWKELWKTICIYLYEKDNETFQYIAMSHFFTKNRKKMIDQTGKFFHLPYKLAQNIYIELYGNAVCFVQAAYHLAEIYKLEYDITYLLKK